MKRPPDLSWQDHAACLGHHSDYWFPGGGKPGADTAFAVAICRSCPVALQCRQYAETHHVLGIWAGRNYVSSAR